tara:strand:+ start:3218 stop:3595 length:378 start_codon:yes stop_codon:yes gene_type:complete
MSKPADKDLYDKIKAKVYKRIPKHSAYRSGIVVQEYKEAFKKKYGNKRSPYIGRKETKKGLSRWFKEKWRTQDGKVGYRKKGDVYRPTKRITKDTPTTFNELSKKEIKKAQQEKKTKGRVKKFKD